MKQTSEILERISKSSNDHKDGVFTRLYRYLLREDIYYIAYWRLYANKGVSTKRIDGDTTDGFGEKYVKPLISELKDVSYRAKPIRTDYIKKENGKMRPLGVPSFRDKLLQETISLIFEAIYEPTFSDNSHGFRPKRNRQTCIKQFKTEFKGVTWFIKGEIKGCFDNMDHKVLIEILQRKIKDSKLINLIRQFLKAGYVWNWTYNPTYGRTLQGGILSLLLTSIYLNELDNKVAEIKANFDSPQRTNEKEAYLEKRNERRRLSSELREEKDEMQRQNLLAALEKNEQELQNISCALQDNKKLVYVRYVDKWLIGISGDETDCEEIKTQIREYLKDTLKLELSEEKTRIIPGSKKTIFLGYGISIRRNQVTRVSKSGRKGKGSKSFGRTATTAPSRDKYVRKTRNV